MALEVFLWTSGVSTYDPELLVDFFQCAFDSDGNVIALNATQIIKFSASGSVLWTVSPGFAFRIAVATDGSIYAAINTSGGLLKKVLIRWRLALDHYVRT